jgi:hypothetical protein
VDGIGCEDFGGVVEVSNIGVYASVSTLAT